MATLFEKIFGSKQNREVKKLQVIVNKINEFYESYKNLSDEDLKGKTVEFKKRVQQGETLEQMIPEAFGVVKEACRRLCGKSWLVEGIMQEWNMVPYDVQLMGGIVLSRGRIAEMATGEGKTLVALFPSYLNALSGKGVHVITVNDYLAKRDSDWMGYVHQFLGLSVGVVTASVRNNETRAKEYQKDITYGVNHEFGFDYLRDNMVSDVREMVQRGFNFCLIDEVDSVLIDDARTPLIISGAVEHQSEQKFQDMKKPVFDLVREQTKLVSSIIAEAEKMLEQEKTREAYILLLQAFKGLPKNRKLTKLLNIPGVKAGIQKIENEFLRDKKMEEITGKLFYAIEEKSHVVDLVSDGHEFLTRNNEDKNLFLLPDLATELQQIDDLEITSVEKEEKRESLHATYSDRSEKIHTLHQLLRAYCLFEKDVDYVVQDGKVIIVDQSTGRLKHDSRFSDGMHQAIEAKEGVVIGKDSQTVATITYQNYFRMYNKLSGMTGTAVTEENEFFDIYNLPVSVMPTNRPIARDDNQDYIYMSKREKYNAVVDEVIRLKEEGRPVLIGTPDVDVSEVMHKLLQRKGVQHNLLNAKNHAHEAQIVAEAGIAGHVTIATNMAGRGTDIKLGPGVKESGGLSILGVERHNSRRIDRQLRGRAGRQGDPGSSRFYVSLEDNLMRIFGSERIAGIMDKFGHEEGEPIVHPWITKSIERAQKRVEMHNFSMRKHVIEYDDVMNKKRNVIYRRRRAALIKGAVSEGLEVPFAHEYGIDPDESMDTEVMEMLGEFIDEIVFKATSHTHIIEDWDIEGLRETLMKTMLIDFKLSDVEINTPEDLVVYLEEKAKAKFSKKTEIIGNEMMIFLCKIAILRAIDTNWQEHLREDDSIRNGIGLMAHAQKDPLVEYKKISAETFRDMLFKIDQEALEFIFKAKFKVQIEQEEEEKKQEEKRLSSLKIKKEKAVKEGKKPVAAEPKVNRNAPCPCGSGKKYKNCCGAGE